VRLNSGREN
jgi:hypothetical protein